MSEKEEVKRDGAKAQKNSGRGYIQKGDAILGPFCVDYKEYEKSFSLSKTVWAKANTDAWKMRKVPALKVILGDERALRLFVVEEKMFKEMLEAWEEKYGEI